MLEVVSPLTFVLGSVDMHVGTVSISLIVGPLTIVHITINMHELAPTVRSVLSPLTNVFSAIRPHLLALAISEPALPFADIHRARLELVGASLLSLLIGVEGLLRGDSLFAFFIGEVL